MRNWYPGARPGEVVVDGGTYYTIGGQPITSNVDFDNKTVTNTTQSEHIFRCGSVSLSIVQEKTLIRLSVVGSGSNSDWLKAAVNWAAGKTIFGGSVERIRQHVRDVGRWSSHGAIANPNAPPSP